MDIHVSKKKLYIILIAAFVIFLYGFGKPHVLPWQASISLNYPVDIEANDGRFIVVDEYSKRIIFVDRHGRVSQIMAVSQLNPSFDVIESVAADDEYLYILGYDTKEGGLDITREHLEKYDSSGRHIKTLYKDTPEDAVTRTCCTLSGIEISDGMVYFTKISDDRKTATVYKIPAQDGIGSVPDCVCAFDSTDDIMCGKYDIKNSTLVVTNLFDEVYLKSADNGKCVPAKDEKYFFAIDPKYMEKALKAYRRSLCEDAGEELTQFNCWCSAEKKDDGSAGKIFFLHYRKHTISCYDTAKETLTVYRKIPVSLIERLNGFIYWLSVLLLVIALLKLLQGQLKKGVSHGMKYTAAITAVSVIIICFYSNALYTQLFEQYKMRVTTLCHTVINYVGKNADEFIHNAHKVNVKSYCREKPQRDSVAAIASDLTKIAKQSGKKDSFIAELYVLGADKRFYALADSRHFFPTGTGVSKEQTNCYLSSSTDSKIINYKDNNTGWLEDEDDGGAYLSRGMVKRDMLGNVALMVLCSCRLDNLQTRVFAKAIETFINLLAFLIAIYVSATIFVTIKTKISTYIINRSKDNTKAAMALVAPYSVIVYAMQNIDAVFFILVSAQLGGGSTAKLAMPALCAGIGATVGKVLQLVLSRIFKNKTLIVSSSAVMALSFVITAFAVNINSLVVFAGAQFVKNLCLQGFVKTIVYKMSYGSTDEKLNRETASSYVTGKNAGGILALFAGGCIATLFDYKTVYLVSAAMSMLLTLFFASTYMDGENEEKKVSFAALASVVNLFAIMFKKEMLLFVAFIFLLKTSIIVYPEKIFPLFATASQISVFLLSNLTMFVKTFNYFFVGKIVAWVSKLNMTREDVAVWLNIVTGLFFIAFRLNCTIFLAIIILFALEMIYDTNTTFCGLYLSSLGKKYGAGGADMVALSEIISGLGITVSSMLVLLFAYGYDNACCIIGVIYITCALFFKALSQ